MLLTHSVQHCTVQLQQLPSGSNSMQPQLLLLTPSSWPASYKCDVTCRTLAWIATRADH